MVDREEAGKEQVRKELCPRHPERTLLDGALRVAKFADLKGESRKRLQGRGLIS